MNTKITTFEFQPYEHKALEEYLEKMASKGWKLKSMFGYILKFKRVEPTKIKYSVISLDDITIFDGENSESSQDFKEYCTESGWDFVCQHYKFQIFSSEKSEDIIPIETSEDIKFPSIIKASIKTLLPQIFIIMMLSFTQLLNFFFYLNPYTLASNLNLIALIIVIILGVVRIMDIINFSTFYFKGKKALKVGESISYPTLKKVNIKRYVFQGLLLTAITLCLFAIFDSPLQIKVLLVMLGYFALYLIISKVISKKNYSRVKKKGLMIANYIISALLFFILLGSAVSSSILSTSNIDNNKLTETPIITHKDFNIPVTNNDDNSPYFNENESIIASYNYYSDEGISYDDFKGEYPFLNRYYGKSKIKLLIEDQPDEYKYTKMDTSKYPQFTGYIGNQNGEGASYLFISNNRVLSLTIYYNDIPSEKVLEIVSSKFMW